MDACEGSVMGGAVSAFVLALPPLPDTLIEQLVGEQSACPQIRCSPCRRASTPMKQRDPEGAA
jgi:hypothetical protein